MAKEELIDLYVEANPHFSGGWGELRDLLNSFADELTPSLPEGLDEAAFAYENAQWEAGMKDCGYAPQDVAAAFKSGWMARDAQIPKLPDDVDEAAYNFALHYDNGTCDGIAQDCFIAGAEWMAGQGHTFETIMQEDEVDELVPTCPDMYNHGYSYADKVIVQIRKK